jgi:hypothetical protein
VVGQPIDRFVDALEGSEVGEFDGFCEGLATG